MEEKLKVWTIGHSNHSITIFLELLDEHGTQTLVDVRRFPTSKVEHLKKEQMKKWLPERGTEYVWLGESLGGYREGGYKRHM